MANFFDIMKTTQGYLRQESAPADFPKLKTLRKKKCTVIRNAQLPPTPGYNKLGSSAREAARSRAKAFYPFD